MTYRLVLVRHGESEWNVKNLFTGWYDADLTEKGASEARRGGRDLLAAGIRPAVMHTSLQTRAIRTAHLALDEMDLLWLPVRRSWRLNERHYGDLQGRNKAETREKYGDEQLMRWRRSYDVPPPPLAWGDERHARFDPRYAGLPPELLPAAECLKDVVARMMPYWYDGIVPDLADGRTVLLVAHGNSLRALVKHLEGISDDEIVGVNIPTGVPLLYELGADWAPLETAASPSPAAQDRVLGRAVGDVDAAKAAAAAVAKQAENKTEP
ncbi:MAG: 2,3-diphosphoglycerate-dependent phosphoglycerate mutase [Actinobacteria bacterium]|nr:2,3-diphosphoglycerate-dependent phosphoglycerate mutase [Actinomycetota bacterium]